MRTCGNCAHRETVDINWQEFECGMYRHDVELRQTACDAWKDRDGEEVDMALLREYIQRSGMTQTAIAERLFITPQALSYKLRGRSGWKVSEARRLQAMLGIPEAEMGAVFLPKKPL